MLQVEELSVEVEGRTVLHDVDLRLAAGEVHVLFGPNGSGKSPSSAIMACCAA
jgi:Fe-S cluster assembly ATP-binding protein